MWVFADEELQDGAQGVVFLADAVGGRVCLEDLLQARGLEFHYTAVVYRPLQHLPGETGFQLFQVDLMRSIRLVHGLAHLAGEFADHSLESAIIYRDFTLFSD